MPSSINDAVAQAPGAAPAADAGASASPTPATKLKQPPAVWAVLAASVVAFMGIGLVDPILPVIGQGLNASHAQIELLFTSYFLIIGVSNLLTGWVSSRIGAKSTLLVGLALVVVFSALAGQANSVGEVVAYRAGWGLGIALFISTSMAVIMSHAAGGPQRAVTLFESALGIGIASGPLLGSLLGNESWRAPFFGVAVLMAIAFAVVATSVPRTPKPTVAERTRLSEPLRALSHKGLALGSVVALLWNFGFFTMLAYTPLLIGLGVYELGAIFFAWGVLVAIAAVYLAPWLLARYNPTTLLAVVLVIIVGLLLIIGAAHDTTAIIVPTIIVSGLPLGVGNSLLSNLLFGVSHTDPADAAAATNFIRFTGGAIAPFLAGVLSENVSAAAPLFVAAAVVAVGFVVLVAGRRLLVAAEAPGSVSSKLTEGDQGKAERELAAA
ncbi:MAG: MFS transporter [Solirubrobacteraceae bacterium]|nr:MFS transporter [Solirubrobacteraceae bacterium]